jgi:SNF2-related domain
MYVYAGTPIHNSLEDLLALIRFLRHEPWSDPAWWRKVIAGTKRLHIGFVMSFLVNIRVLSVQPL